MLDRVRAWVWVCPLLLSAAGAALAQETEARVEDPSSTEVSAAHEAEEQRPETTPPTLEKQEGAAFEDTGAPSPGSAKDEEGDEADAPPAAGQPARAEPAPTEAAARHEELGFYASLRGFVGTDTEDVAVRDNASRFGLFGAKEFSPGWGFYARSELGVNFVEEFNRFLKEAGGPMERPIPTPTSSGAATRSIPEASKGLGGSGWESKALVPRGLRVLEWMEWTNQRLASPGPWIERTQRIQKRDTRGTATAI